MGKSPLDIVNSTCYGLESGRGRQSVCMHTHTYSSPLFLCLFLFPFPFPFLFFSLSLPLRALLEGQYSWSTMSRQGSGSRWWWRGRQGSDHAVLCWTLQGIWILFKVWDHLLKEFKWVNMIKFEKKKCNLFFEQIEIGKTTGGQCGIC